MILFLPADIVFLECELLLSVDFLLLDGGSEVPSGWNRHGDT